MTIETTPAHVREGKKTTTEQACEMLDAFTSVGVSGFEMSKVALGGEKIKHESKPRGLESLRRTIGATLEIAEAERCRIIIRPRGSRNRLIQLDDLTEEQLETVKNLCFMGVCTSPKNFQAWVAVTDSPNDPEEARAFAKRLKIGVGADENASGATIIAGCRNFKRRYEPDFPLVAVAAVNAGRTSTFAELDAAGLLGALPAPPELLFRSRTGSVGGAGRKQWPDYQRALLGAPRKGDGTPDRSLGDYVWCCTAATWDRGNGLRWSAEEIADELYRLSEKAKERGRKGGRAYCLDTARKASRAAW